jgi:hypothetical protein
MAGIVLTHVNRGHPIDLGSTSQQRDALAQPVHLVGTRSGLAFSGTYPIIFPLGKNTFPRKDPR